MFGTYRTFLALAVVATHLLSIPIIGHYAVHGFFVLSGYLMTLIMSNSYGYTAKGLSAFATNRFLRLYPPYWAIIAISLVFMFIWGEEAVNTYRRFIYFPDSPASWIQNLTLIYFNVFPGTVVPRISPQTWALTIELFFYLLIALGISKNKILTLFWLLCSVIFMAYSHLSGLVHEYRYSFILAGSLPFAMGATIYHYRSVIAKCLRNRNLTYIIVSLFALFLINSLCAAIVKYYKFPAGLFYVSFYMNYFINAALIIALMHGKIPFISERWDKRIGDLSYPVYLFHWQAGFAASMLLWGEPLRGRSYEGIVSFMLACVLCVIVSILIIKFVDQPIQNIRIRIKKKASSKLVAN